MRARARARDGKEETVFSLSLSRNIINITKIDVRDNELYTNNGRYYKRFDEYGRTDGEKIKRPNNSRNAILCLTLSRIYTETAFIFPGRENEHTVFHNALVLGLFAEGP